MEKAPGLPPCERGVQARSLFAYTENVSDALFVDDKGKMAESTSVAQNAFQTPTGPNCRQSTQASGMMKTM